MKKKRRWLLLLLAIFLIAGPLFSWLSFPSDSPDDLKRLIRLHEKRWPQVDGLLSPSTLPVHCSAPALRSIAALNDGLILRFRWTKNHPEGYKVVVYLPDDHCDIGAYLQTDTFQKMMPWELREETENLIYWGGGYIGGRGYIRAERLLPCWFLVEAYFPT
ncbi:MAG: hypothetical protein E7329_00195 [Clostridiales bacterium]|nr:hypothetical protein [Clostridiales bacterium]